MSAFGYHGDGVLSKVRKDGRRVYFIQYWYRGRRLTEKVGMVEDTARGLARARRRMIDEDPAYVPPSVKRKAEAKARGQRIRFKEFAAEFIKKWGTMRRSHATFFRPMANRLAEEFGGTYLDDLTTRRLQAFVSGRALKVGPATVNHDVRFLRNMLNRAVEWGYLKENPAVKLRQLPQPPGREVFLSQEESDRLLEKAPKHVRPVTEFALLTGMRRSEILGLTWDRVDLAARTIRLLKTKNGEARVVPIGDDLKALLEAIPQHVTHPYVFTYYGRPIKSL